MSFSPRRLIHVVALLVILDPASSFAQDSSGEIESSAPDSATPAATFEGGATRIVETHRDWLVDCQIRDERKTCAVTQTRGNRQTRQRSMAINLAVQPDGSARATLLLPPGMKRDAGVSLALDGAPFGPRLSVADCRSEACIVPMALDRSAVQALNSGTTLAIDLVRQGDDSEPATFSVSLDGFASAARRSVTLTER